MEGFIELLKITEVHVSRLFVQLRGFSAAQPSAVPSKTPPMNVVIQRSPEAAKL
jgi:hypothetical protein